MTISVTAGWWERSRRNNRNERAPRAVHCYKWLGGKLVSFCGKEELTDEDSPRVPRTPSANHPAGYWGSWLRPCAKCEARFSVTPRRDLYSNTSPYLEAARTVRAQKSLELVEFNHELERPVAGIHEKGRTIARPLTDKIPAVKGRRRSSAKGTRPGARPRKPAKR